MAGNDLSNIISQLSQYSNVLGQDALQGVAQNRDLRTQVVDATTKAAGIEVDLAQYDLQQQLEMESRKKAAGQAFGSDILDPDNRVAMLAREQVAAQDEWLAKSKRSTQLLDMGFFDSPLEYMVARPFTNRVIESATIAKERMIGLDKAIADINQGTQQTVQTQKALNTELTLDEAAQKAELVKIKADSVIAAAQIQANEAGFKDFKTIYELDRHEREFNARMAEMAAAREARAAAKKAEKESLQEQMELYNRGARVLGKPQATSVEDFSAMIKINKKYVGELIEQGAGVWVDPNDPNNRAEQIAPTPGESVVLLNYFKGSLNPKSERVNEFLKNESIAATENIRKTQTKFTQEDVANQVNKQMKGYQKGEELVPGSLSVMQQNVEQNVGNNRNIFRAPDVQTMVTARPELAQNPAFAQIVQPAVNASGPSPTVDSMLKQAQIAIKEKKLTPEAASSFISKYYSDAVVINASTEKYNLVGIKQPKGYPVQVKVLGSNKTVDATSEEQLNRVLAQTSTAGALQSIFGGTNIYMGR